MLMISFVFLFLALELFLISHLVAPFLQLSDCESHNIGETCKGDDSCYWNEIWYWFDSFHWFTWFPYVIQSPSYASLCYGSQVVMFLEKEQKITSGRATWCFTSIQYVNNYNMSSVSMFSMLIAEFILICW